jgi:hypothetical protein
MYSDVVVRHLYGIMVVVDNQSGEVLRDVAVQVVAKGKRYPLPDLKPGQTRRLLVRPVGESAIDLEFTDAKNLRHTELLAGYVEDGYCGKATATVYANRVDSRDDTFGMIYWKSWLDFVW